MRKLRTWKNEVEQSLKVIIEDVPEKNARKDTRKTHSWYSVCHTVINNIHISLVF